jgi:TPR repeat protein
MQDKAKGLEYYFRGAELGSSSASSCVADAYYYGDVIAKDEKTATHYYEQAAMQGNNGARHNLGIDEANAGKYNRALQHWLIACERGNSNAGSLKNIKRLFVAGRATKEDYEKALLSFQAYVDEIKSDQRDEAAAMSEQYKYIDC